MLPDIPREELDLLKRASALLSNAEERLLLLAEDMTRQAVGLRAMVVSGEVTEEEAEAELRAWRDGIAESEEAMAFEAARVQALHAAQVVAEQLSRKGKTPYEVRRYIIEMPKALVAAPRPLDEAPAFDVVVDTSPLQLLLDDDSDEEQATTQAKAPKGKRQLGLAGAKAQATPWLDHAPWLSPGLDPDPGRSHNKLPRLSDFDIVAVSSSGGKDSQTALDVVMERAKKEGVESRVVVVHCDLGRVEWKGTKELTLEQARRYGLRTEVASREQGDLLAQVKQRKKWPGAAQRYCTSDHKRGPTHRVYTKLVREMRSRWIAEGAPLRPVRVLEVLGIRAEESPKRAKMSPIETNEAASNATMRHVTAWLPLHDWTEEEVWARIRHSGVPYHQAYDLGMPRLSCAFCVLGSRDSLMIAGLHNPELLEEYVEVEKEIGHEFQHRKPIREIKEALARGEKPKYSRTGWTD